MTANEMIVLGLPVKLQELYVKDRLPLVFTMDYDFYKGNILDKECLILHFKGEYLSIPRLRKHFEIISELLGVTTPCVLWLDEVNSVRRERLIENSIPFFVDEKMVFLPFLGTQLEKRQGITRKELPEKFTTATQCVFLWLLYNDTQECHNFRIMKDLQLSQATVARALLLLEQYGLLTFEGKATRKRYFRIEAKLFWEGGKKYMQSPVQKRLFMEDVTPLLNLETFTAGEEALAKMSMIQDPEHQCIAVYKKHFDKLKAFAVESSDMLYSEDYTIVELWNYDPGLFAKPCTDNVSEYNNVDLFSLYASLGNLIDDVRVEKELKNLMEDFFNG